jgi:hypothetical protein
MAQLVIPNAAVMQLRWSGATRTWRNVIGILGTGTLPAINQALADTLHAEIGAAANWSALMALIADSNTWEGITLRSISTPSQPEFTSTGTPLGGGSLSETLPLNVAAVVTIRTAFAGASFRGRTYFTGFGEAQNDALGRHSTAVSTAIQGAMVSINSVLAGHGMTVAVLSRPRDAATIPAKTILAKAGTAAAVNAFVVRNTKWESQRRRTGRE